MVRELREIERLEPEVIAALRARSPAERLALGIDCNRAARVLITGQLRTLHPDWTEMQISAELARRMLHGPS